MKKFGYVILTLIVILAVALGAVYFALDDIVKYAINKYAPQAAGLPVSVETVALKPFDGHFSIGGLKIGNPAQFSKPDIATIGNITAEVDMKSLFTNKITVKSINVNSPTITYEMLSLTNNNIAAILKQLGNKTSDSAAAQPSKQDKTSAASKDVVIKVVNVKGGKIEAALNLNGQTIAEEVPLPDIEIKDIGEKKERSLKDSVIYIVQDVLQQALQAVVSVNAVDLNKIADKNMQGIVDKVKSKMGNLGIFGNK